MGVLVTVEHDTGDKKVSQTTVLASGVEWTTGSLLHNKVILTVEVIPDRKFEGAFDWNLKNDHSGTVHVDVKGSNPHFGDYELTRKGDFQCTATDLLLNWTGKTKVARGLLANFSPIDSLVKVHFDKTTNHLDANLIETIGGKRWGVTVAQNKFSLLGGRA